MNAPSAVHVASAIVDLALEEGIEINHLKLQKLLYIGQGWSLSLKHQVLFREPVESWQYGPIVSAVYYKLGNYPV